MKKFYKILIPFVLSASVLMTGCQTPVIGNIEEKTEVQTSLYLHRDGFAITAPNDFTENKYVESVGLKLSRDDAEIEVFKETFSTEEECKVYSSYSNLGFLNKSGHVTDKVQEIEINGKKALQTQWHRDKSGKKDKNYYSVTDIYNGTDVYSIIVKADKPMNELDFDVDMLNTTLEFFAPVDTAEEARKPKNSVRKMNEETKTLYEEYFGDNGNFHWGLYYHRQPVDGMEKFEALEEKVGKMDMALLYTEILEEYDPYMVYGGLVNAWNSGKVCEITLQTDIDADDLEVYRILNGERDEVLYAYAKDIVRFGHPVFMRPFNEMNGEWCNYSSYRLSRDPDLYIRLYRYVYDIFEKCGAKNLIWIWNPNEVSYPTFKWNDMMMYYPGDRYVDVVGLSGYNTGTGISFERWRSMEEIYDGYYEHMASFGKPMMITEFGCASAGGDKLQWVKDMFEVFPRKYPLIRGAIWLHERNTDENGNTTRSFFLDDTEGVPEVFKEHLNK